MSISSIDQTKKAVLNQEIKLMKAGRQICIYYPETACKAPKLQFMICRSCPKAAQFIKKNVIRSIFDYVRSLAVSMLSK